jgi:uncharacterized membrane protein YgaE (UPF0421/DUF939 family)
LTVVNPVARLRQSSRTPLLQVLKTAVAVVAAVLVSRAVFPSVAFPTFAAIAALLVVQPSINQSFARGLERSAGVVMGVVLATIAHIVLGDAVWVVLLVIVLAILIAWALRLTPTSSTQVGISGMLVLTTGVVTPHYSAERIVETVLGAAIALIVNALIVPPVLLQPAHLGVARLARDTASTFERIALGITARQDRAAWERDLLLARRLRTTQAESDRALTAARDSLTMNPRSGRHRTVLEQDIVAAGHLSVIVTRAIGMTRAIHDNVSPDLFDDRTMDRIATEVARIAVDVRAIGVGSTATGPVAPEPALTAPVTVLAPNPEHWILIGSLLEDIRRVREEVLSGGS